MQFTPPDFTTMHELTVAAEDPAIDIAATIDALADVIALAVPSFTGLSVRTGTDRARLELDSGHGDTDADDIRASLLITLPPAGRPPIRTTIVFYAHAKGAFIDLAADLTRAGGTRVISVVVDGDLTPPAYADPRETLHAMSAIDRAIGILLGHGYLPEQARRHIYQRAALAAVSTHTAADMIMNDLLTGTDHPGSQREVPPPLVA